MVDLALTPVFSDEAAGGTASHIVATGADITEAWFAQAEHEERMVIEAKALRLVLEARRARGGRRTRFGSPALRARLGRLSAVALELVHAESVEDLTEIIFNQGVPVLGAEGGALLVADPAGDPDVLIYRTHRGGRVVRERQPAASPLPGPHVARTGRPIVLADRTAGLAFSPEMARVYNETNLSAWLFVPLSVGRKLIGSLAVAWADERNIEDDDIELVDAFATQCAFALDRIESSRARRRAAGQMRLMVESLQRALLDRPDLPDDITVAARYLPAVHGAQIGGDWF